VGEPGDYRTKWVVAAALVAAGYLWAWSQTPVDPQGDESVAEPMIVVATMTVPPGLAIAALSARFAERSRFAYVTAWVAVVAYGLWTAVWTGVMAIWSGELFYCGEPGLPSCFTDWPPRLALLPTVAATLAGCILVETRLRKRWSRSSAPS
jgi:hypothetical protein